MTTTEPKQTGAAALPTYEACFSGKTACCFTGHRPSGLPDRESGAYLLLRARLMDAVLAAAQAGVTHFLAGGAQGFDTMAAEAVLFLREQQGLPLKLTLAMPCLMQAEHWPAADWKAYEHILSRADATYYAGETNAPYNMLRRNRYLVDHADCCICYLRETKGGTFYTVNYALEHGLPVYNLALVCG